MRGCISCLDPTSVASARTFDELNGRSCNCDVEVDGTGDRRDNPFRIDHSGKNGCRGGRKNNAPRGTIPDAEALNGRVIDHHPLAIDPQGQGIAVCGRQARA